MSSIAERQANFTEESGLLSLKASVNACNQCFNYLALFA